MVGELPFLLEREDDDEEERGAEMDEEMAHGGEDHGEPIRRYHETLHSIIRRLLAADVATILDSIVKGMKERRLRSPHGFSWGPGHAAEAACPS